MAACSDPREGERRILQSQLEEYETSRRALADDLTSQKAALSQFRNEYRSLQAELANLDRKTKAYVMNHKLAVSAIMLGVAGANVVFDETNRYAPEESFWSGVVTIVAWYYAINNFEEIVEVYDTVTQADANRKRLENRMAWLAGEAKPLEESIAATNSNYERVNGQVNEVRRQLVLLSN